MKRALFILHLPPPVHGSSVVGRQIHESQVIQEGLECRFINLNTSPTTDAIGRKSPQKLVTYLGILWRVLWQLVFWRPQLAYIAITVKGWAFFKDFGVIALLKLFRTPLIYHLHNKGVASCQDRWPYRWLYPWVFENCHVILLSKRLYPDIARYVSEDQVEYCPNGIPDRAANFVRQPPGSPPTLMYLSNLIESKGIYLLLDACRQLKEQGIAFKCFFVGGEGDVSEKAFNARCERDGIAEEVHYLGKRYGDEKDNLFATADIFVLPTFYHNECLPLVLLEAMMWRLPVVSTYEGGIPDVVVDNETGFLASRRDVSALVEKLGTLLTEPNLCQRMGVAGRERFEIQFTSGIFEKKLRSILINTLP